MRLRDLIIVVALLASTVLISGLAMVLGSEVYFLLPSRRGGVDPPPDHPATYIVLLAIVVGLFFLSARYAAIALTAVTAGAFLGLAVGWAAFEWTPGICQYLLMISLTATTVFVWSCEELSSD
jgi:hypothetical protein